MLKSVTSLHEYISSSMLKIVYGLLSHLHGPSLGLGAYHSIDSDREHAHTPSQTA